MGSGQPGRYHRRMRKLLTWLLVTLGIAALVRKLRKREAEAQPMEAQPAPVAPPEADPADELRRKLAETHMDEAAATASAEESVEERRADIHEQGRSALDEMQSSEEG
jgi:hypothetical protein